jgi:hypothetical protein
VEVYADGPARAAADHGKIIHQTEFWPDPFAPEPWRAQWVERMDSFQPTFLEAVEEGMRDFEAGRVVARTEVMAMLEERRPRPADNIK